MYQWLHWTLDMPVCNLKHVGVELVLDEAGLVLGLLYATGLFAI